MWLGLWVVTELLVVRYAATTLGLILWGILNMVLSGFFVELDLLAVMLLTTYTAVFVLLGLLFSQFSSWKGSAERAGGRTLVRGNSVVFFCVIFGLSGSSLG
jgi:hypothetical protein